MVLPNYEAVAAVPPVDVVGERTVGMYYLMAMECFQIR
jgi:hypothetical protein